MKHFQKGLTKTITPSFLKGLAISLSLVPAHTSAISFVLTDTTPGGIDPAALAGFQQATTIWEGIIQDNIVVNIDIRFGSSDFSGNPLGSNVLGSASSSTNGFSYTNVRGALVADTSSANDAIAVANLPSGSNLSFLTNDSSTGAIFTDANDTSNNRILDINTANAKALGLLTANAPGTDAQIAFNNSFNWDFDQTDGIGSGLQDFVGVTVHEIGHALGFVSGVDIVDATQGTASSTGTNLDNFRVHSVLDLFRYSGPDQLNFATGGDPFFSIDGGNTSLATFSTGAANGDGQQASHWEDGLGLGILDPTANAPGNINLLSQLDIDSLDVIGFDIVPEPSTAFMALMGLAFCLRRRK